MTLPTPTPNPWLPEDAYRVPRHPAPVALNLDGNEGIGPESLRRYPSPAPLEARLAERFGLSPDRVLVTAGGDEGLMRMCRAFLGPGRNLILPEPSFEMIRRYAEACQGEVRSVPYTTEGYPTDAVLAACDADTAVIAVVSPNNPTGGVISPADLQRLSAEVPQAMLMVDLAYVEFAELDLTPVALTLPNALVFRTFSKARGLAGLRVGYAMGSERWVSLLRTVGLPYPVSAPGLETALASLEATADVDEAVDLLRRERTRVAAALREAAPEVFPSQGNFVFARGVDGRWWRDGMAGLGIGIRAWPQSPSLADAIRISCPTSAEDGDRLCRAIQTLTRPEALLFDLDGVLADVSRSYREAIIRTAERYGVTVQPEDIDAIKAAGDANNDWVVTWRLVTQSGVSATLEDVTTTFEALYQGREAAPALYLRETVLGSREVLSALAARYRLAIVTGRPRGDAERFLADFELSGLFEAVVCLEDAPPKPNPAPVQLALETLGVTRAWMFGDTPDDVVAARQAGVLPIGVLPPGTSSEAYTQTLLGAGAAVVLRQWDEIQERLS